MRVNLIFTVCLKNMFSFSTFSAILEHEFQFQNFYFLEGLIKPVNKLKNLPNTNN